MLHSSDFLLDDRGVLLGGPEWFLVVKCLHALWVKLNLAMLTPRGRRVTKATFAHTPMYVTPSLTPVTERKLRWFVRCGQHHWSTNWSTNVPVDQTDVANDWTRAYRHLCTRTR
jgi:hypothetical protein